MSIDEKAFKAALEASDFALLHQWSIRDVIESYEAARTVAGMGDDFTKVLEQAQKDYAAETNSEIREESTYDNGFNKGVQTGLEMAKAHYRTTKRETLNPETLIECLKIQQYRLKEVVWTIGNDETICQHITNHNLPMIERVLAGGEILPKGDVTEDGETNA